jgi:glycosyltransferase involved in cell wall biosynthesis
VPRPLRPLFFSEGALGTGVLGHTAVVAALRSGLGGLAGVEPRFCGPPPLRRGSRLAARPVPLLFRYGLDFQPTRWHLVQSLHARRAIDGALEAGPADVLYVNSHSSALLLGRAMGSVPTFLSVDVTFWDWERMGVWQPVRPWTRPTLAASLSLERRALTSARVVVAWTTWAAEAARRAAPGARVIALHPGVDLARFRPAERRRRERARVLFVGGRFAEKGGLELVEALGPRLGHDLELDVVTADTPPTRPGIRAHRLGPGDPGLVELLQQADVFCLPTRGDAAPFAVVEAMACGTPVVATATGAIPELLGDGEAGVLVPAGDLGGLAKAHAELLGDPDRRAALGRAARDRVERRYDSRRQTAELVRLMREAT